MAAWDDRKTWRAREAVQRSADEKVQAGDYGARATREAAAVLDECGVSVAAIDRGVIIALMAACWLQGVNYGTHETLALAEAAFERVKEQL